MQCERGSTFLKIKVIYWHMWFREEPLTFMESFHSTKTVFIVEKVSLNVSNGSLEKQNCSFMALMRNPPLGTYRVSLKEIKQEKHYRHL